MRDQLRRLAAFDAPGSPHVPTVLLEGETGTGKGLIARQMHASGPRAAGPFIDVNCAAIPEAMLEAELFGFEAGAFTDAKKAKPGLFEVASGGTLFLDEIDALSPPVQSKVLKAIEDKLVRRLGAVEGHVIDAKLVAATQRDLEGLVERGIFRADLYHRLAVLVLRVPPLRERGDDAVALAQHYIDLFSRAHGLEAKRLSADAHAWLTTYAWPGNVRELAHLMERITFLCTERDVDRRMLEEYCMRAPARAPDRAAIASPAATPPGDAEAEQIAAALRTTGGNVARAARLLGIGRNALRYRMRRAQIEPPASEPVAAPAAPSSLPPAPPREASLARLPSWEQKPVAVLVLTLSSPAPDASAAGYEPWTAAHHWQRAVVDRIAGFGGSLLQQSPGRLTAVFGVPRALEQLPVRAVQAALAIERALASGGGPRPEMRAAVHTGEVTVDMHAADPLARLLPVGEVFALPERLLGHAGAGEVLVSPHAARRVERSCALQPRALQLGPEPSDRLTAYRAAAPRSTAPPPRAAGDRGPTRFVGRAREVDLLLDAFERTAAGHGQVVFVAGEAGIGKSRLIAELRARLDGRPHVWIEGRCASYGTGTPFLPLIDGLRRYLGIDDEDDDASASAKIAAEVGRLGEELTWTIPFVQQILSLRVGDAAVSELDSASRRSELFRALRALTLRLAELDPVVAVIEDLHWIDPASEEYLAFLGDAIPTTRVMVVLTHRTGYAQPFGDRSFHQRATLVPLDGREISAMTGSVLGVAEVPEALHALIAAKADGNPFFVEEITRSLLEDGSLRRTDNRVELARDLAEISVPDSIQDVLMARIDRLAEASRHAIQVASVIGREFALRLLARISEGGDHIRTQVDELRQVELIYEKAADPELAYMFKHALTHDVAYESVVRDRRRSLHSTIGLAIEELYADRLPEHYETLAHHFARAEDWPRALLYHERAAEKAAATYANRAVVEHCRRALDIAARVGAERPERRQPLNERLARALFLLSAFADSGRAYEAAAADALQDAQRSRLLCAAGYSYFWGHRYDEATRCLDAATALAADAPVARARVQVARSFGRVVHGADVGELQRDGRAALEVCVRYGDREAEAFVSVHLFQAAEWESRFSAVLPAAERAIALGRELRTPEHVVFATWFLGKARCCTGDFGGALALLLEACDLCERIGDRAWRSRILNTLGWCYAEIGAVDRAREHNQRAHALAREIGDPEILANAAINLAFNHLALGQRDEALEHLEPIEAALSRAGDPWMRWRYALHALHVRAEVELSRGEPDKALAALAAEIEGARRHRVPKLEARALLARGAALLAADRRVETDAAARAALSMAEDIGYRRGVWRAHRLLADLEHRAGHTAPAAAHAAAALGVARLAAATLTEPDLRRHILAAVSRE